MLDCPVEMVRRDGSILFPRAQIPQDRAFLTALARSGNARAAARDLGVHRSTMLKRRGKSAAFALAQSPDLR